MPTTLRWVILGILAVVGLSRSPYIFHHGRFFAEEGVLHFRYMYTHSFPKNILYVQTRTGYYNAFVDWGTLLAAHVPLVRAPLVTTWLSFGLVMVLLWVALAWPSDLLPNVGAKLAAAALLLVGPQAIPEIWANTINAQTYLCIAALLLLFSRVEDLRRWRYGISVALLVLAGLSGLYTVALFPLFLVAALLDRNWRRWGYVIALGIVSAIQGAVFLHSRSSGTLAASKTAVPSGPSVFRSIAGWHLDALVIPQRQLQRWVAQVQSHQSTPSVELALLAMLVAAAIGVLLWFAADRRVTLMLIAAFVIVEGLVLVGDLNGDASGRYATVPIAILGLMLIYGASTSKQSVLTWAGGAVVVLVLLIGLRDFWSFDTVRLRCENCPDWSAQVHRYERGHTTHLKIWPYTRNWQIKLPQQKVIGFLREPSPLTGPVLPGRGAAAVAPPSLVWDPRTQTWVPSGGG